MVQVIAVEPFEDGWALSQTLSDNPQIFFSGAKAEDAARRLGARYSSAGAPTEIRIFLRDGTLAGRFVCAPD